MSKHVFWINQPAKNITSTHATPPDGCCFFPIYKKKRAIDDLPKWTLFLKFILALSFRVDFQQRLRPVRRALFAADAVDFGDVLAKAHVQHARFAVRLDRLRLHLRAWLRQFAWDQRRQVRHQLRAVCARRAASPSAAQLRACFYFLLQKFKRASCARQLVLRRARRHLPGAATASLPKSQRILKWSKSNLEFPPIRPKTETP